MLKVDPSVLFICPTNIYTDSLGPRSRCVTVSTLPTWASGPLSIKNVTTKPCEGCTKPTGRDITGHPDQGSRRRAGKRRTTGQIDRELREWDEKQGERPEVWTKPLWWSRLILQEEGLQAPRYRERVFGGGLGAMAQATICKRIRFCPKTCSWAKA